MPELSLVKETIVRWKGQRRELTWGHLCSLVLQSPRRRQRRAAWRRAPTTPGPPTGHLRPFLLGVTQAPWWQRWSSQASRPLLKWGLGVH